MKKKVKKESGPSRVQKANKKRQKEYEILSKMESFFIEHFDPETKFAIFARELVTKNEDPDTLKDDEIGVLVDSLLSMGFLVGQLFEVTDPEILGQVELMKQIIREKGLLPCLPKEKKAA